MNDLIKELAEKFGMSEEKAYQAVRIIINYLKEKLSDPAASQINNILISNDGKDTPGNSIKDLGSNFTTK